MLRTLQICWFPFEYHVDVCHSEDYEKANGEHQWVWEVTSPRSLFSMLQHIREIGLALMAGRGVVDFEFFEVHKGTVVFGFLHGDNRMSWRLARSWGSVEGSRENEGLKFRRGTMGQSKV